MIKFVAALLITLFTRVPIVRFREPLSSLYSVSVEEELGTPSDKVKVYHAQLVFIITWEHCIQNVHDTYMYVIRTCI